MEYLLAYKFKYLMAPVLLVLATREVCQQQKTNLLMINVDFANRQDTSIAVATDFIGSGFGFFGRYQDYAWQLLKDAGIVNVRFDANIPQVYSTFTPNWSKIDSLVSFVARQHLHPILILDYTPDWLIPETTYCLPGKDPHHAIPSDI